MFRLRFRGYFQANENIPKNSLGKKQLMLMKQEALIW
jgi:hypothetical protein